MATEESAREEETVIQLETVVFPARYHGSCPRCGSDVKGHLVAYLPEYPATPEQPWGFPVHVNCILTNLDKDVKKPVCPDCFMIHPEGACDA